MCGLKELTKTGSGDASLVVSFVYLISSTTDGIGFLSAHKVHPNLIGYITPALATEVSDLEDLKEILDLKVSVPNIFMHF